MPDVLTIEVVLDVERTLRDRPNSDHALPLMRLLRKWKNEDGLQKEPEVQALIDRLIDELGDKYPK